MKAKGRMALLSLVIISIVLTVAAAGVLFWQKTSLRKAVELLEVQFKTLVIDQALNPYPSPENIEATRQNVKTLTSAMANLRKAMNAGQMTVDPSLEPLPWRAMMTTMKRDLTEAARKNSIEVPKSCSFGFERYDDGTSPTDPRDVKRLSVQLEMIRRICEILYDSGIKAIVSVKREEFEGQGQSVTKEAPGGVPAVIVTNVVPLFAKEHFKIEMRAKEAALITALNRLASDKMFTVVCRVKVEGIPIEAVGASASGVEAGVEEVAATDEDSGVSSPAKKGAKDFRPREKRVVTGRGHEEPARVWLDLDVYEFGEYEAVPVK